MELLPDWLDPSQILSRTGTVYLHCAYIWKPISLWRSAMHSVDLFPEVYYKPKLSFSAMKKKKAAHILLTKKHLLCWWIIHIKILVTVWPQVPVIISAHYKLSVQTPETSTLETPCKCLLLTFWWPTIAQSFSQWDIFHCQVGGVLLVVKLHVDNSTVIEFILFKLASQFVRTDEWSDDRTVFHCRTNGSSFICRILKTSHLLFKVWKITQYLIENF